SNSLERSTVATPSLIVSPRSCDPSGTTVLIDRPASAELGPARRAFIAARATAVVPGTSRRTATRPALPSPPPSQKYARTTVVPAGAWLEPGLSDAVGPVEGWSVGSSEG